jgi:hypothetical protein
MLGRIVGVAVDGVIVGDFVGDGLGTKEGLILTNG